MEKPLTKRQILTALAIVGGAAIAIVLYAYLTIPKEIVTDLSTSIETDRMAEEDPIWDPLPMPKLLAEGDESIPDYWKRYEIDGTEYEAFAVFARIQKEDGDTGILFDGFFASEKYVSELSGISCDITRAPATETETGYNVKTDHGTLVFIEDEQGLRIDRSASTGLGYGCFRGVTWADMPAFTASDRGSIWPGEYYGILNRG